MLLQPVAAVEARALIVEPLHEEAQPVAIVGGGEVRAHGGVHAQLFLRARLSHVAVVAHETFNAAA
ncbi:MAG: hypothetical protein IPF87_17740 [Gemmatimonadetes bacterium]|nr:hypothetical protein [Gemmatimonadota bacterium]